MKFEDIQKKIKDYDWRSLKKLASPNAANELNVFLEKLPQNAGQTMLIIAGAVWVGAAGLGLYTTVQLQQLTELRAELQEASAVQPMVPKIQDVPVEAAQVNSFVEKMKEIYSGLSIESNGASINISSGTTAAFGQFREAVGHVQNGGSGWRVNIENFCVGRECEGAQLYASLSINKVSVN